MSVEITYNVADKASVLRARESMMAAYAEACTDELHTTADYLADDIIAGGKPLADTVVIIPVAAHQEAKNIGPALDQYARQQPNRPFTVVLGMNAPDYELPGIDASYQAVAEAKQKHPHLDVRATNLTMYADPHIGAIRGDLWDGVTIAAHRSGLFKEGKDVLAINNDIDLSYMARTTIARLQTAHDDRADRYIVGISNGVMALRLRHAWSADHPNISRAVTWHDYACRQGKMYYEAGLVIPLSRYAHLGGFDPELTTHEVISFMDKGSQMRVPQIAGTDAETSPRRYIRFMGKLGYDVWRDGNFSAYDDCRTDTSQEDISTETMREVVTGVADNMICAILNGGLDTEMLSKEFLTELSIAERTVSQRRENVRHFQDIVMTRWGARALLTIERLFDDPTITASYQTAYDKMRAELATPTNAVIC